MSAKVHAGKPMIHGDFKPGESCRATGVYDCRTCADRGRRSRVTVEAGRPFPECAECKAHGVHEVDTVWKLVSS